MRSGRWPKLRLSQEYGDLITPVLASGNDSSLRISLRLTGATLSRWTENWLMLEFQLTSVKLTLKGKQGDIFIKG